MKVVVAILSDIHLSDAAQHPFAKRIDQLAAAIGSAEIAPEATLVILGGDIASKGDPAEYAAMSNLLRTEGRARIKIPESSAMVRLRPR